MENKLIEAIKLENGLTLEIIDISRSIALDSCQVGIIFRIKIKINNDISDYNNISDKLGDEIEYEVKHERNFISNNEKDKVLDDVKESFLYTNLKYLSHKNFKEKYIMKKFNESKKLIY